MSEEYTFDKFLDRFDALVKEAGEYGFDSVVVIREWDRLGIIEDTKDVARRGTEEVRASYSSGISLALGMLEFARVKLSKEIGE